MVWDRPPNLRVFGFPLNALDLYAKGTACHAVPISLIPIILGALEELKSPDAWKGEPETVALTLQQIGHFIGTWGTVFSECKGDIQTVYETVPAGGGIVIEDDDMGQVVTDVDASPDGKGLRIHYGYCCWKDIDLSDLLAEITTPPPAGEDTPDMPTGYDEPTACDKVIRWTDLLFDIIGTLVSYACDAEYPGTAIHTIKNAWPTITFGEADLALAFAAATDICLNGVADETQDEVIRQRIRCTLAPYVSDGPQGITKAEYNDIQSALSALVNGAFGVLSFPLAYAGMRQIYITTARAIGAGDTEKWTMQCAPSVTYDCDCPGGSDLDAATDPDANGWYWSQQVTKTVQAVGDYSTYLCLPHSMEQDCFGWRFVLERDDNNKNYKRMSPSTAGCGGANNAWGDTSDHLEYASSSFIWSGGKLTLLQTLFGDMGLTQGVDWSRESSNYADSDNPATPSYAQGTLVSHAWEGSSMTSGDTYTIKMRWLFNTNSPSHQS
jgi:hypothetical protein